MPTEVHTDASLLGIVGILLQKYDDRLHPVVYFSFQISPAEQMYHSYERETLAVVKSLKKFRGHLLGIKFTVVTNCNAFKSCVIQQTLPPYTGRWVLQLEEFDYEVQPGTRMQHVDARSQNPVETESLCEEKPYVLCIEHEDWILSSQLTDPKLQEIYAALQQPPGNPKGKYVHQEYALQEGRLYR